MYKLLVRFDHGLVTETFVTQASAIAAAQWATTKGCDALVVGDEDLKSRAARARAGRGGTALAQSIRRKRVR